MQKILFLFLIFSTGAKAQHLAAFFDERNYFCVFDDGILRTLEHDTVINYQTGSNFLAYINPNNELVYYTQGISTVIEDDKPNAFFVSQNYLAYKVGSELKILDHGVMKTATTKCESFALGDSLLAFIDKKDSTLKVYWNGEIKIIEKGAKKIAVSQLSVSQDLVAYLTLNKDLKIWWHGKSYFLSKDGQNSGFRIGTALVAFADQPTNEFNIFYKGEILKFPKLFPRTLKVNNNSVAYVDQNGHFDVFYNGETIMISTQEPFDFAALWDQVSYIVDNEYRVFHKGKIYVLDDNPSGVYVLDQTSDLISKIPVGNAVLFYPRNSFIYYDRTGIQNIFYKGEIRKNTSWQTDEKLIGVDDLIVFTDAFGKISIYYKGRKY